MKILFLDDSSERAAVFRRNSVGHDVTYCTTAAEAIDALASAAFDRAYLDHDLDEEHQNQVRDDLEDGRTVARSLASDPERHRDCLFVLHSLNEPARRAMCDILRDAGLRGILHPFAWTEPVGD